MFKKWKKAFIWGFLIAFIGAIVLSALSLINVKNLAQGSVSVIYDGFKSFGESLLDLKSEEAGKAITKIKGEIDNLKSSSAIMFFTTFIPQLKEVPEVIDDLDELANASDLINQSLGYIKNNAFNLIFNQEGEKLIQELNILAQNIEYAEEVSNNLRDKAASLGYPLGKEFVDTSIKMQKVRKFLQALISWLDQPEEQNLILLFQNHSEIRPAGGFAGSYAEVILEKGGLSHLKVNDIYYPDKFLDLKVIPPKALQGITPNWGARDAGWFFDFPTSAQKILDLLEASNIYQKNNINFSALIGLNVNVIESILEIMGPITLDEYGLVIDHNNFLAEIQREVEAGDDKAAGDPKRILRVLTPIFFDKIANLDDAAKQKLFEKIKEHMAAKDIQAFFEDRVLESYIQSSDLGGEIFMLPDNFSGDYLAIVNSNIAGGKTDEFIEQKIMLQSRVDLGGNISNHLTIQRAHSGQDEEDWWYRATNKNYIQILTPRYSNINEINGNNYHYIKPPLNYANRGYQADNDLAAIEGTTKFIEDLLLDEFFQFGKKTFATWFDIKAGERKELSIRYNVPKAVMVEDGGRYELVFDKQAGVDSELELAIRAPAGYKWEESDSVVFKYESDNLPTRVIISLTLRKG